MKIKEMMKSKKVKGAAAAILVSAIYFFWPEAAPDIMDFFKMMAENMPVDGEVPAEALPVE